MARRTAVRVLLAALAAGGTTPAVATAAPVLPPPPAGVVAQVHRADGSVYAAIGEAQYLRFYGAALSEAQQRPVRTTVPLVPPAFDACVNGRRWMEDGARPRRASARLRACRRIHDESRDRAMSQVLSLNWVGLEAERLGIVFTESRLARERRALVRDQFRGKRAFERFVRGSGLSEDDIRLNLAAQLGQSALVRHVSESVPPAEDPIARQEAELVAISEFRTDFLLRSHAQTSCAPAYVTLPACSPTPPADAPEPA